jgi:hypothetical protein
MQETIIWILYQIKTQNNHINYFIPTSLYEILMKKVIIAAE